MSGRARTARRIAVLAAVVAALAVVLGTSASARRPRPFRPTSPIPTAVESDQALAFALLHRLAPGAGNVVFSPYSIEAALAMARAGAAGTTAAEIDSVLHTAHPAALAQGLAELGASLIGAGPGAPQLNVANSLWVQAGLPLRAPFTRTLSADFGASPQTVDFANAAETARAAINAWVAAHTAGEIPDLFPEGSITNQTALVLADAIYLAAKWRYPFDPSSTTSESFYPPAGPPVPAMFMTRAPARLLYGRGRGYQAVELPYRGSTLSMLFVMPVAGTLKRFERGLSPASLAGIERGLVGKRLIVNVPRFEEQYDADLTDVLSALGMPIAFTDAADFSGITHSIGLKIAAVEHAADLRVDEAGTVAVGATGITLVPTSIERFVGPSLTLNHPFLAILHDDVTGTVLFVAQVTNPA